MIPQRRVPRIARWGVPAGAVALTGIIAVGYTVAGAQAAPALPSRTPVQLLAAVSSARVPPPMTAVIQESASLGIPDLPSSGSAGDPLSALSWLSGTHTVQIWYADQAHLRIAVPVQLGESDIRRDGRDVWYWNSQTNQATHYVLPAQASASSPDSSSAALSGTAPTPQQVAKQLLAAVGPTTKVGLQQNVMIAGQAAYQISLAPKASGSLIGQIRIAIDARQALPLRVQIFARGASSPAFQVGFTSLQFGTPSAANFAFSPPSGAKVNTVTVPAGVGPGALARITAGVSVSASISSSSGSGAFSSRLTISAPTPQQLLKIMKARRSMVLRRLPTGAPVIPAIPGAALRIMRENFVAHLPKSMSAAQRQAALKKFEQAIERARALPRPAGGRVAYVSGSVPLGLGAVPGLGLPSAGAPTVLGKAWLTVLAFSTNGTANQLPQLLVPGKIVHIGPGKVERIPAGSALRASVHGQTPVQAAIAAPGPVGQDLAILGVLLRTATAVHGSWGSGRLLTTGLISVLITNNGKVLVGAVTPAVLYADAAHLK